MNSGHTTWINGNDQFSIQVPGRMSEDGHDDREANEDRDGADDEQRRDDYPPNRNRHWIGKRGAYARIHGRDRTNIPIQEQRERHHRRRQHNDCKNETSKIPPDNEGKTLRGRQHVRQKR